MINRLREYYREKANEARAKLPSLELPEMMGTTKSILAAPRHSREDAEGETATAPPVTDVELEALYREYTGAAEAGFTPETFLAIVRKLDPQGYNSDGEVMRLFEEIDIDSSGNVDLEEFIDWTRHELEGAELLKKMRGRFASASPKAAEGPAEALPAAEAVAAVG